MISHGIPSASDENGTTGQQTTPNKNKEPSRFHTGTSLSSEQRDPARERADIPPGGARSRTSPQIAGRGRRVDQWQQINPPFPFSKSGVGPKGHVKNQEFFARATHTIKAQTRKQGQTR